MTRGSRASFWKLFVGNTDGYGGFIPRMGLASTGGCHVEKISSLCTYLKTKFMHVEFWSSVQLIYLILS